MTYWRRGARAAGWWFAAVLGIAFVLVNLDGLIRNEIADAGTLYFVATMSVGMLVGLWAWAWRSARIGRLMFWWPALWLASQVTVAYPTSRLASTVGLALFLFGPIVFAQMALSYPTGRLLPGRLAWLFVFVLGYSAQAIQNVVNVLFYDPAACPFCAPAATKTYFYVGASPISLETWNEAWSVFVMAILPIGLYLLYRAYATASVGARRSLGPLVATATFITCTSWVQIYLVLTGRLEPLSLLSWVMTTGALVAAVTALLGLGVTRLVRGSVGDLVVELDHAGPGEVRRALARAIGDPTLELALWLPERSVWVDEAGTEMALPHGHDRAVTLVGEDLAALVHDPVLLDQPALLEAVGSAARLALENERLQAELRLQLAELRDSRTRIVRAGDEERRRLERNLHDGAQQRLLGIGMALQLLRARLDGSDQAVALLDETEAEMQIALRELRELARGIHPAVLTDQGLGAAVRTLAERSPVPVEVRDAADRLPAHVETAAYFVVAELLANVAKHADASRAWVTIERRNGLAVVEVRDDGVGGASAVAEGSGLSGLADRVGALDGRLRVDSPRGGGTHVLAEIPCGS